MTEAMLAQFNDGMEWSDFVIQAIDAAAKHPADLALRDAVAKKAERFEGGGEEVKKIWREAQLKAEDAAVEADRGKLEKTSQSSPPSSPKSFPASLKPKPASPAPRAIPVSFQHQKKPSGIAVSLQNALHVIDKLKIDCRYDKFHDRIITQGHESGVKCSGLNSLDNVALKVRQTVLERFGFDPTTVLIQDALRMRCLDNVFDPVLDYLDGLVWDGKPRLGGWLVHYCGAKDTELNREIGQKMLIAAMRRVRSPGCKFDYIVVLEGSQGVGKSTVLKLLAGDENFSDAEIIGSDKREQLEAVQGVWIYEIAELDGLHKSEVTKVKTVDSARPAYGRAREDRPRRGIFVATTNEDTYLRDETGNRRFWPVRILKVDLDAVARDRDQLWAEAAAAEASGEQLVISEHLWAEAATAQRARMEIDPWHDVIAARLGQFEGNAKRGGSAVGGQFAVAADHLGNPEWRVSSDYLLTSVLEISKDRQTNNHTKRLAAVMRSLGWSLSEGTIRIGKPCRGYTKAMPEQPIEATPEPAHELIENQAKPIPKPIPVAPAFVRRI